MVDGEKNIEDIQIGDEVYACDVETGEVGLKKVKQTFVHEEYGIVHVTVKQTTIDTTIEHPFYVEGYGFKPAGELQFGDKVRLLDGTYATVEKITIECLEQPIYVYNFEVEDVHTYYVSSIGVLVHNDCSPTTSEGGSGSYINESGKKITAGKNYKDHYVRHKGLLTQLTNKKYSKYKVDGQTFLDDVGVAIDNGLVNYEGLGTIKKDMPAMKIYRGNGRTIVTTVDDEFVTILETGKGLDKAIQMIEQ